MKRLVTTTFAVAMFAITFASIASACTRTPRIDRREVRQDRRIEQGVRSGALTPREEMRLRMGQVHVDRMEVRAKSDGFVSPAERARIAHAQNRESRAIWRKKHNRRVA